MDASPTMSAGSEWLRELAAARTHYEELLGWPVRMEVGQRCLTVPVGRALDALIMPAPLGEKVLAELTIMMLAGPVTTGPGGGWWTFLSRPVPAPRPGVPAALRRLRVRPAPRGTPVIIPTPVDGDSGWRWIQPPHSGGSLPQWPLIIGATRRVGAEAVGSRR